MPHIRIFPDGETTSEDELTAWLMTSLKARNGEYLLKDARWVKDLPTGSIVFFRKNTNIVGEGVVVRTESHLEDEYKASVWFSPSSIRMFVPAIPVSTLQQVTDEVKNLEVPNSYTRFDDCNFYPKLLAAHVEKGGSFL